MDFYDEKTFPLCLLPLSFLSSLKRPFQCLDCDLHVIGQGVDVLLGLGIPQDTGEVLSLTVQFDPSMLVLTRLCRTGRRSPVRASPPRHRCGGNAVPAPGVGCSVTPAALRRRHFGEQRRDSFDDRSLWGFASRFLGTNFCSVSYKG